MYSFSQDSLMIEYLAAERISSKIQHWTDSTIKTDSLPIVNYIIKNDTLKLTYVRIESDTIDLTLLPFHPKKTNTTIEQLETVLLKHNWLFEYEGIKFDATFLNKYYSPKIRHSEIQVYYEDKIVRTLEMPLWKIESYKNQLILLIENPFDNYYANVFFINEVTTGGDIKTSTWQYGTQYDVIFKRQDLIDSTELEKKWKKLIASWDIQSSIEEKEPEIDPNDTTYIDLGQIGIWGIINMNTVIEETDLAKGGITYKFLSDSSYQLIKNNNVVCSGSWQLLRNGRVVKLTTDSDLSDEYQTDCNDFLITMLTNEVLSLEQYIPVYENDSTVPNRYYELKMAKTMHNNGYE